MAKIRFFSYNTTTIILNFAIYSINSSVIFTKKLKVKLCLFFRERKSISLLATCLKSTNNHRLRK